MPPAGSEVRPFAIKQFGEAGECRRGYAIKDGAGTDLGFGSAFDRLVSSAWGSCSRRVIRPFDSPSCSREDDRLVGKRLVRVLITPEENVSAFSPSFPLGDRTSRGQPPR